MYGDGIIHVKIEKMLNTIKDKDVEEQLKYIIASLVKYPTNQSVKWIVK